MEAKKSKPIFRTETFFSTEKSGITEHKIFFRVFNIFMPSDWNPDEELSLIPPNDIITETYAVK